MPNILRQKLLNANKGSINIGSSVLPTMDETDIEHLVQWSDMLVYDYLTGNYDRVSSMQDAAEKEDKPSILKETIHNLAMSETTGSLWFIDNESAFLDAYSLLYDETSANGSKFQRFHKKMLQTMCVFRKKTIHRLFALKQSMDPAQLLLEFVAMNEPLFEKLPKIHPNSVFREHFSQRINEVWSWIQECQMQVQYKPSPK
jgi:four-jointed box protein 1